MKANEAAKNISHFSLKLISQKYSQYNKHLEFLVANILKERRSDE